MILTTSDVYMLVWSLMNVALCFNIKRNHPSTDPALQKDAEFDSPETIVAITNALRSGNHNVTEIEADENVYIKLKELRNSIDIVFNIAEGIYGDAREAQVPTICDILQIPYTHSSTLTCAIQLDKAFTKKILIYHSIPTPKFQLFSNPNETLDKELKFPLFLKPNSQGSSMGIRNENLVENVQQLKKRISWEFKEYRNQVLVEEYLPGREFTVSLLGNPPTILPIIEQRLDHLPKGYAPFSSYDVKWLWEDTLVDKTQAYDCPARLSPQLQNSIESICSSTFHILGIRDIARVDVRLDKDGNPYILEINALPGLMPDIMGISYFPISAQAAGYSYNQTILKILDVAAKRLGIISK
ncbi:MAG: ATP-grasp domain-containing protein [Patescibacteria group bacterium]